MVSKVQSLKLDTSVWSNEIVQVGVAMGSEVFFILYVCMYMYIYIYIYIIIINFFYSNYQDFWYPQWFYHNVFHKLGLIFVCSSSS